MSRTKRAAQTLFAGYSASAVSIILGLLATPWLVRWLGNERFGAFIVLGNYLGYLGLLELGIGGAIQVALVETGGRDAEPARAAAIVRSGLRRYRRPLLAAILALTVLILATPALLRANPNVIAEAQWGLLIAGITVLFMPLGTFRSFTEAGQRGFIVHSGVMAQTIVTSLFALALAAVGLGLVGQWTAVLLGALTMHLVIVLDSLRRLPAGWWRGGIDATASDELRSHQTPSLIINLLGRLCLYSDAIILSLIVSTAVVTPFTLTQKLPSLIGLQLFTIGAASWTALGQLYHEGHIARMEHRLVQLTRLISLIGAILLVPVAVGNQVFVELWVGPDNDAGLSITLLAVANAWIQSIIAFWGWTFAAVGRLREIIPSLAMGAVVNILVSIAATYWLGPPGPLIGTAAQLFGINAWFHPLTLRNRVGFAMRPLLAAAVGPLLLAVPVIAAAYTLFHIYPPSYWTSDRLGQWTILAGSMAMLMSFYLALAWRLVVQPEERQELLQKFRRFRSHH